MESRMKSRIFPLCAVVLALLISTDRGLSQYSAATGTIESRSTVEPLRTFVPINSSTADAASARSAFVRLAPSGTASPRLFRPFSRIGFDYHTGLGGIGLNVATPLSRKLNVRVGSDFFRYSTTLQQQGATVGISLRMQSSHTSLDWFPFGGRFRLSPQMVFANNNLIQATALIPSGSSITLNGHNYISSYSDPLHGAGSIDFRKISPGFTLGFGNIIPRTKAHLSIPIEAGFYYVGQPGLKANFSGSACDPALPPAIGCQSVTQNPGFQQDLSAFVARNNKNLSYASFFPVLSLGFGYSF